MTLEDICETGPTVYSPYPRRLESVIICGCNYKQLCYVMLWPICYVML